MTDGTAADSGQIVRDRVLAEQIINIYQQAQVAVYASLFVAAVIGAVFWPVADRRIKQIIVNLLSNATKFTDHGGKVELKVRHDDGGQLGLSVTGNGPEIASSDFKRVMEPFERLELSHHGDSEGSGLGLPLCNRLIELHGGSLILESEIGKGTSVTVWLPPERAVRAYSR
jgi:signal transduction histidine kinase